MTLHRRDFVKLGSAAALVSALGLRAGAAATPTVGLIFPPLNYPLPPDAKRLFPSGLNFVSNGLGFNGMTIDSYNEAIPRALPRAKELADQGADLISVFGSSITFYKGAAFNKELTDKVTALTGKPATTQSNGLVDGLKHVNARRIAVATAYTDVVTTRLMVFLREHGFDVAAAKGLGYERIPEGAATPQILHDLGVAAFKAAGSNADALVMSCGGLRTLDVIVPLEKAIGVPVVSSTPHGLWHCARMLKLPAKIDGFGMVMAA
ncbi:MAG TPA: arylmalonate decarboxylase [Gammaproteobacteria bacterium]|jgi:arylmalonate decarboxylase|nr:arylmalonate decarboxylase [Gammaproteobacteria bacterium]